MLQPRFLVVGGMILLATIVRLLPYIMAACGIGSIHDPQGMPWNMAPVGAICLFGGAYLADRRWAFAVPLISLVASDLGIGILMGDIWFGLHPLIPVVYGSFLLMVWLGTSLQNSRERWPGLVTRLVAIGGTAFVAELLFFVTTNFANWYFQSAIAPDTPPLFPYTAAGLVANYVAALPFFGKSLIGTLAYGAALFGGYELLQRFVWAPQPALAEAK